jgi:hypothetical protein
MAESQKLREKEKKKRLTLKLAQVITINLPKLLRTQGSVTAQQGAIPVNPINARPRSSVQIRSAKPA